MSINSKYIYRSRHRSGVSLVRDRFLMGNKSGFLKNKLSRNFIDNYIEYEKNKSNKEMTRSLIYMYAHKYEKDVIDSQITHHSNILSEVNGKLDCKDYNNLFLHINNYLVKNPDFSSEDLYFLISCLVTKDPKTFKYKLNIEQDRPRFQKIISDMGITEHMFVNASISVEQILNRPVNVRYEYKQFSKEDLAKKRESIFASFDLLHEKNNSHKPITHEVAIKHREELILKAIDDIYKIDNKSIELSVSDIETMLLPKVLIKDSYLSDLRFKNKEVRDIINNLNEELIKSNLNGVMVNYGTEENPEFCSPVIYKYSYDTEYIKNHIVLADSVTATYKDILDKMSNDISTMIKYNRKNDISEYISEISENGLYSRYVNSNVLTLHNNNKNLKNINESYFEYVEGMNKGIENKDITLITTPKLVKKYSNHSKVYNIDKDAALKYKEERQKYINEFAISNKYRLVPNYRTFLNSLRNELRTKYKSTPDIDEGLNEIADNIKDVIDNRPLYKVKNLVYNVVNNLNSRLNMIIPENLSSFRKIDIAKNLMKVNVMLLKNKDYPIPLKAAKFIFKSLSEQCIKSGAMEYNLTYDFNRNVKVDKFLPLETLSHLIKKSLENEDDIKNSMNSVFKGLKLKKSNEYEIYNYLVNTDIKNKYKINSNDNLLEQAQKHIEKVRNSYYKMPSDEETMDNILSKAAEIKKYQNEIKESDDLKDVFEKMDNILKIMSTEKLFHDDMFEDLKDIGIFEKNKKLLSDKILKNNPLFNKILAYCVCSYKEENRDIFTSSIKNLGIDMNNYYESIQSMLQKDEIRNNFFKLYIYLNYPDMLHNQIIKYKSYANNKNYEYFVEKYSNLVLDNISSTTNLNQFLKVKDFLETNKQTAYYNTRIVNNITGNQYNFNVINNHNKEGINVNYSLINNIGSKHINSDKNIINLLFDVARKRKNRNFDEVKKLVSENREALLRGYYNVDIRDKYIKLIKNRHSKVIRNLSDFKKLYKGQGITGTGDYSNNKYMNNKDTRKILKDIYKRLNKNQVLSKNEIDLDMKVVRKLDMPDMSKGVIKNIEPSKNDKSDNYIKLN